MAMVSVRKAFASRLLENALRNENIFAVTTDSRGSAVMGAFGKQLPERLIEFGIAEQNAVAAAAGISKTGKNIFVTGPASFLSARAYEQVKIDVAYNKANVKIIGVSAGVSYGPLGCTHTTMHDFAGMRTLPNIAVLAPSDAVQASWLADKLCSEQGPYYVRMGRGDVESVYETGEDFEIGCAKLVSEGNDITLIACGEMVAAARGAGEILKQQGISARVLDCFTIKPLDSDSILKAAQETKGIITIEEHSTNGGLGEAVAHVVAQIGGVPVKILGLPEEVIIGKSSELFEYYGLTAEAIAKVAADMLG